MTVIDAKLADYQRWGQYEWHRMGMNPASGAIGTCCGIESRIEALPIPLVAEPNFGPIHLEDICPRCAQLTGLVEDGQGG